MVEDYPRNVIELGERFATEEACREYLARLRWPEGFVCNQCGATEVWKTTRGRLVCRVCRYQASVTAGTIFQDTHKPLRLWFHAIWHITSQKNGASAASMQQILGLGSYQTAWTWLHKLRRVMWSGLGETAFTVASKPMRHMWVRKMGIQTDVR